MQSKLWILITDFFFALEEPSNQVTKKLSFFLKEKERRSKLVFQNMLGNGVLLDGLWRDLPQRLGENGKSNQTIRFSNFRFNHFGCLQTRLENGITYKSNLTTQFVKQNIYCILKPLKQIDRKITNQTSSAILPY